VVNTTDNLGTEKISKLLVRIAIPTIAAQFINLLYNLVDRMYIGHIPEVGVQALTGVGVCVPLIIIIAAFAGFVSFGCAPRASIFLGQKDYAKAQKILGSSFVFLIALGLVLTIGFFIFAKDLLLLFGASENTIYYALRYMYIYSIGIIFVQLSLGLNSFISCQGFAKTSMLAILIGAVLNIILDPIFIFVLNMDTAGAALATVISQAISMIWILYFLSGKKTNIRLDKQYFKFDYKAILPGLGLGLSPFIMGVTDSLIIICFNIVLFQYGGDIAVGAMTILFSVFQFSMMPVMGLSQSAQPIISYNYGAGYAKRVIKTFWLTIRACTIY
jgi:putative MATE family efflux protein